MTIETPVLYDQDLNDLITNIKDELGTSGWEGHEGEAGMALVYLFGRLAELVITRMNQVPDQHFLAFLNEAGVDLLAPRSASADLTFTPAKDSPSSVKVPAGTQVATKKTETESEVIFETERALVAVTNTLVKCVAFDPLNFSDCTAKATGQTSGSFAVFQGDQERERLLYLGDNDLFMFSDDASRQAARITLSFEFDQPGDHVRDGWELEWLYWDGSAWSSLAEAGASVSDDTQGFSKDGDVELTNLPELTETEVDGVSALWLACKLTEGSARDHLPVLSSVKGSRSIDITQSQTASDLMGFSALQSGTTFVPLDTAGEFFPLGQIPGRLDAFYLRVDEAFSKQGAAIEIHMNLEGVKNLQNDSELTKLRVQWQYYSPDGWVSLGTSSYDSGVESPLSGFTDSTNAFTANGDTSVTFTCVNLGDESLKPFEKTTVNDQKGYWVRARVIAGSYNEPGKMNDEWLPLKTHAPVISNLKVTYSGYTAPSIVSKPIMLCRSRVDGIGRDHSTTLLKHAFTPFSAAEEGPAVYLGFQRVFPTGEWIELLVDVDEEQIGDETLPTVFWEYWNGDQWILLRVSDHSQGLTERGYLGFFGPDDHQSSTEFEQSAYWLRARPHRPPEADAGDDISVTTGNDEATVTLNAIASQSFDGENISRYIWRLVSSTPPVADAGEDQKEFTTSDEVNVTLDASGSTTCAGRQITRYIWRRVRAEEKQTTTSVATPFVKVVRLNTVPALNAVTISEEVLGSSDGKQNQVFSLLRPPVLPDAQISVREPDRPPVEELEELEHELQKVEEGAKVLPYGITSDEEGVWVRWHVVSDFHESGPQSRHCILDPIEGQIRFGDDERGKIPPAGSNNIKAMLYHTHNGASGNAQAATITMLLNPSGDVANIKGVTNYEAAVGGSDKETTDEVKQRGPQTLKHRDRAVTVEDFVWLARDASGEIAHAWCYPTRDMNGLTHEGWVTVVVIPRSADQRPSPTPALLRHVRGYLEARTLANLKEAGSILVKAPEYVEAQVDARIVPEHMEQGDEVKLDVLERLNRFFHPLTGGPERQGWELGRNVFLSEVYAEIEAVPGVDHVAALSLSGSIQQQLITLTPGATIPVAVRKGNLISTFDDRIRLLLAEHLEPSVDGEERASVSVYGFKVGDRVNIVDAYNTVVKKGITLASTGEGGRCIFDLPCGTDDAFPPVSELALMTVDERLRLPLVAWITNGATTGEITGAMVQGFEEGNILCIASGGQRLPDLFSVATVEEVHDRISVPDGHLIWSGAHRLEMILEE